jgi:signal transduction histidine kinase
MTDRESTRPLVQTPAISPPPRFRERRVTFRRAEDREAHREKVLLARSLDILAGEQSPEARLAGLLRLLARTAGARRAAVVADGIERRAVVAVEPGENPTAAEALAAWLDATSTRSMAARAAAPQAPISLVVARADEAGDDTAEDVPDAGSAMAPADRPGPRPEGAATPRAAPGARSAGRIEQVPAGWYAMIGIPGAGRVVLAFEFARRDAAEALAERLPAQLARHAAVALALVTKQLATERELASLRANEAERAQFVSTVAHELRTPLTGLRGYLELILGHQVADPEVATEFLERSRDIVESMAELVGDLLEISRIESGTLALAHEPFSVAEAASGVAERLLPIAFERQIRLETTLPPKLRSATGDRRRVEQVLTNLAANALKFTPSGGLVELIGRFDGPVAIIVVRDDGAGIAPDDRARIFERFARLAAHDRITGTGLGLPIARDLARRMSGDIDVASIPDAGSAFVMALPGPTAVDPATLAEALARAVLAEEIAIEERAVLRSLGWTAAGPGDDAAGGAGGRRLAKHPTGRSTRLTALPSPRRPDTRSA